MRITSDWRSGSVGKGNPGEPLFTLEEIGLRLGTTAKQITALMRWHPGLQSWQTMGSSFNSASPERRLYRMSDVRKWWWSLPVESRQKAKMK